MIRATIKVFDEFPRISAAVDALAREAVQDAAEEGAKVASEIAAERTRTGEMAHMKVLPAHSSLDGWAAGFSSAAWYRWFQDRGTLGRRRPKAKKPGTKRTHDAGTGIEPLRFYEIARTAGRRKLFARIRRGH